MESSRAVGALNSFTPPQEYIPMRKQVSRLCFILLGRLPATKLLQWLAVSVRPLHGYWGSPEFSSVFPCRWLPPAPLSGADAHAIHLAIV